MKLLLVLGSDDTHNRIALHVKPLGFELIRYNNVLKAMDNVDEIDPQAIIISAIDFPRHWKTMVQFVRNERSKESCPIIILKGDNFHVEEVTKASFLGVSSIIAEAMDSYSEVDRLHRILGRYMPVDERRQDRRFQVEPWQRLGFVFITPTGNVLVLGEIKDISSGGLSFLPDNPSLMKDISLHMTIDECSLREGDSIFSPVCRIARAGRLVSMEFLSFPDGEEEIHAAYLENLPLLGLKIINQKPNQP
jgi:hypothetical protein